MEVDRRTVLVRTIDGRRGMIENVEPAPDGGSPVFTLRFDGVGTVQVPSSDLDLAEDGTYLLKVSPESLVAGRRPQAADAPQTVSTTTAGRPAAHGQRHPVERSAESLVVPVVEESLEVGKRAVETGRVRISKTVREREEVIDEPLMQEEVDVQRVPVNRVVDGPVPIRYEGETMIIPLLEEELVVVEKRLVLREELHVMRRRVDVRKPQTVTLRSEEATVERIDPDQEIRRAAS
jgi:uncharacterized protein (TIGR02271 family)